MTRSLNIDRFEQADREWKEEVKQNFYSLTRSLKQPLQEKIADFWLSKLDEYVEFFNAEPEEEKVDKMPCAICKKEFEWKDVTRVRGLGMWCKNCLDKDEEQAGGTSAGGII